MSNTEHKIQKQSQYLCFSKASFSLNNLSQLFLKWFRNVRNIESEQKPKLSFSADFQNTILIDLLQVYSFDIIFCCIYEVSQFSYFRVIQQSKFIPLSFNLLSIIICMTTQRSKFLQWIDFRVRITIQDGRMMVGTFLAFDKHMNIVLADTEEYRITKTNKTGVQKQIKRSLGLVIIRGQNIISLTAEAPPSQTFKKSETETSKPGKATTINRPGTIPVQPPISGMPSLVPSNAPLPSNLKAPNISINLPKPPNMPPPL